MTVQVPRLPFSLDPLIAEARRRARQRRFLIALVAVVVALAMGGAVFATRSAASLVAGPPAPGCPPHIGADERRRVLCWLHGPAQRVPAGGEQPLEREAIGIADEA
jgi:hypothetical protein